jgi:membrane peptidoglycan carboxypeptidase
VRTPPVLVRLALGLVLSLAAGVVLAGLALPVVGGIGLVGKSAAEEIKPEKPPALTLAQRSRILDKDGHVIATLFTENRVPVRLTDVPDLAQKALIAIEDNRFYEHRGLDVKGTLRALLRNSSSGSVQQGGSTLTQQYVKNMLIEGASTSTGQKAAVQRSVKRKLQEAKYALYLEEHYSKDQILEGYLNIAYYGNGVYGIGAAASHYFSRSVRTLTVAQGALLAGMVQNPRGYDPVLHPKAAVTRRNTVLGRMADLGYLTPLQRTRAASEGLGLRITTVGSGCEAPGVSAPFFCDYVRRYLEEGPAGAALGATRQDRQERLLAGGLTIQTTLDPVVQKAAQQAVDSRVPAKDPFGAAAVADTVEPGTGAVRAMAIDRTYGNSKGETKVNYAIGETRGFQAGSTFKLFVLTRALQMGIPPNLTLYAPQHYCPKAFAYQTATGCGVSNAGDSEAGTFDLVKATWESVNTYFLQLEERTGLVTPPGLASALGVEDLGSGSPEPLPRTNASFVLGTPQVSPLAMAGAYAAFAAHGQFCPPQPVTAITDSHGRLDHLGARLRPELDRPAIADLVTSILRGVIDGPAPARTGAGASIGRPAAGKTGTTNSSTAAWFVGFTPQLATAVWVGKPVPTPMVGVVINGSYYKQVYGGTIPAAIWKQLMSQALAGVPVADFEGAPLRPSTLGALPPKPSVPTASATPAPTPTTGTGPGGPGGPVPGTSSSPAPAPAPKPTKTKPPH